MTLNLGAEGGCWLVWCWAGQGRAGLQAGEECLAGTLESCGFKPSLVPAVPLLVE